MSNLLDSRGIPLVPSLVPWDVPQAETGRDKVLSEDLPLCTCGATDYAGGGGTLGHDGSTQWFSCRNCGHHVFVWAQWPFTVALRSVKPEEIPDNAVTWINTHLAVAMRAAAEWIPPQLPIEVRGYVRGGHGWREVDHALSTATPLPIDPIRILLPERLALGGRGGREVTGAVQFALDGSAATVGARQAAGVSARGGRGVEGGGVREGRHRARVRPVSPERAGLRSADAGDNSGDAPQGD